MSAPLFAATTLGAVVLLMLGELRVSRANETRLLRRGAVVPPDPVYKTMRWAYPGVFAAMAVEGAIGAAAPGRVAAAGAVLFVAAKALKYWAISSLGWRWTYRVFVLPGAPLVSTGPYRFLRHPNYVAVLGELAGMALLMEARVTGPAGTLAFGYLLVRRIRAEERALSADRAAAAGPGGGESTTAAARPSTPVS